MNWSSGGGGNMVFQSNDFFLLPFFSDTSSRGTSEKSWLGEEGFLGALHSRLPLIGDFDGKTKELTLATVPTTKDTTYRQSIATRCMLLQAKWKNLKAFNKEEWDLFNRFLVLGLCSVPWGIAVPLIRSNDSNRLVSHPHGGPKNNIITLLRKSLVMEWMMSANQVEEAMMREQPNFLSEWESIQKPFCPKKLFK